MILIGQKTCLLDGITLGRGEGGGWTVGGANLGMDAVENWLMGGGWSRHEWHVFRMDSEMGDDMVEWIDGSHGNRGCS